MSHLILNKKGVTIVETMIAVFLTMTAVISLMPMFDMATRTSTRSDYLGRAVGMLQQELEFREFQVMHGVIPSSTPTVFADQIITASGLASKAGDATFTIKTTMTKQGAYSWLVNVQVIWTGNNTGVKNSILVTTQYNFL